MLPRHLILPVETAARELDAKLLLSLFAVNKGFRVTLGTKALLNLSIGKLDPGIYLSHNFNLGRDRIISIASLLDHSVVAWDEEGLVWINQEVYRKRRANLKSIQNLDAIFLWGNEQARALQPLTDGLPARSWVVGNPRADLLRPELRPLFRKKTDALVAELGNFILVNSNFGWINHALAKHSQNDDLQHLKKVAAKSGFSLPYLQHRYEVYKAFTHMIPLIAKRFPDRKIVVRPHPSESREGWLAHTKGLDNVSVRYDNDLVPWLLAAGHIVQNGCTTAVETAMLGRMAVSFRPVIRADHEIPQPNLISHHATSVEELTGLLQRSDITDVQPQDIIAQLDDMVASLRGEFASERIVDSLLNLNRSPQHVSTASRMAGKSFAFLRRLEKTMLSYKSGNASQMSYVSQKFPPTPAVEIQNRLNELAQVLDMPSPEVAELSDRIFEIKPIRSVY
jgi:surface carbohydrate biosynthesis protein